MNGMQQDSKSSLKKSSVAVALIILAVVLVFFMGLFLMQTIKPDLLQSIDAFSQSIMTLTQIVRFMLYAIAFYYWDSLIRWVARMQNWTDDHLQRAIQGRKTTITVLILIELFLISQVHLVAYDMIQKG